LLPLLCFGLRAASLVYRWAGWLPERRLGRLGVSICETPDTWNLNRGRQRRSAGSDSAEDTNGTLSATMAAASRISVADRLTANFSTCFGGMSPAYSAASAKGPGGCPYETESASARW